MNDAADIAARAQRFNDAVRAFTPPSPTRHAKLMPLKDGIVELRQKGASLRLIRELLATVGVAVSTDTIARFLAEVNGEPPPRHDHRNVAPRPPRLHSSFDSITTTRVTADPRRPPAKRQPNVHARRGPRIADPRNLYPPHLQMNKQINLVINGKGGVGKSFFATNFVQYLKDRGVAHRAIDSDHENSTLKRFHPEADFINLEHRREIDRVFTTAETCDLLVIDCRAASTDLFIDFFDEVGLTEVLRSIDARLTVICPVNHEADSVEQFRILSDALRDQLRLGCREERSAQRHVQDLRKQQDAPASCRCSCTRARSRCRALYDWLVTALNEHNSPVTARAHESRIQPARSAAPEALAVAVLSAALSRC